MERAPILQELIFAGVAVVAGVALAVLLRVVVRRLRTRASRTPWNGDDVLLDALRDLGSWALVVAATWLAAAQLPLYGWLRTWVDRLMLAALILLATLAVMRLVANLVRLGLARTGVAGSASIFVNIARVATLVVGVLVLLQTVGVSITPLLTALGVGGIAIALALQDTLANLFAGVHILASKKVQPGDYIQLSDGLEGYVVDINWRNTTMQDLLDNMVIVPNATLSSSVVINNDQPNKSLLILIQARVGYDVDLTHVERVTAAVAREVLASVDGGDSGYDPLVRFHTFGESSIDFSVILQVEEYGDQYLIKHEFIKQLHERYRSEGIRIPFPTRSVELSDSPDGAPVRLAGTSAPADRAARQAASAKPAPAPYDSTT